MASKETKNQYSQLIELGWRGIQMNQAKTILGAFDEKAAEYNDYESTTRRMKEVREVLERTLDEELVNSHPKELEKQAWEVISEIYHQDKAYWEDVKNHYLNSLQ